MVIKSLSRPWLLTLLVAIVVKSLSCPCMVILLVAVVLKSLSRPWMATLLGTVLTVAVTEAESSDILVEDQAALDRATGLR